VRLGVASVGFPSDEIAKFNTEEDIETIINSQLEKSPDDDIDLGILFVNSIIEHCIMHSILLTYIYNLNVYFRKNLN